MAAAFLTIVTAAGAVLIGRLAGPADAVPVAFFGLWGALLVWILDRVPAPDDPVPSAPERTADAQVPI